MCWLMMVFQIHIIGVVDYGQDYECMKGETKRPDEVWVATAAAVTLHRICWRIDDGVELCMAGGRAPGMEYGSRTALGE